MQAFAQQPHLKRNLAKLALGLPRENDGPKPKPTRRLHNNPQLLRHKRHAAPVFYHLTKGPNGTLTVRVTTMVVRRLPDEAASRRMLSDLVAFLQ